MNDPIADADADTPGTPPDPIPGAPRDRDEAASQPFVETNRPEPQPATISSAEVPTVLCPNCSAKLRNARADAGTMIRCLNCGKRFDPLRMPGAAAPITASAQNESAASVQAAAPEIREPKAAGYWMLRIPATIYTVLILLTFVAMVPYFISDVLFSRYSSGRLENLLPLLYFPLMPISAFYAFVLPRALGRLETHSLKRAWHDKLIQHTLPAVRGSSLPYILPLAAGPASIFLSYVGEMATSGRHDEEFIVYAGSWTLGSFVLAFMIEDLRQFFWRQNALAEILAKNAAEQSGRTPVLTPPNTQAPGLSLLAAFSMLSFAVMFGVIFASAWDRNAGARSDREFLEFKSAIIGLLTLAGMALTCFLMGRNFANAVKAWMRAAANVPGRTRFSSYERDAIDPPALVLSVTLCLFAAVGSLALLAENSRFEERLIFDFFGVFLGFCYFLALGFFVMQIAAVLRRWNDPKAEFWQSRVSLFIHITAALVIAIILMEMVSHSNRRLDEAMALFFGILGGILVCLTLARVYRETRRWRAALTLFWAARGNLRRPPELPLFAKIVFQSSIWLTVLQLLMIAILALSNSGFGPSSRGSDMLLFACAMFALHFPTVWIALMAREILLAQDAAAALQEPPGIVADAVRAA